MSTIRGTIRGGQVVFETSPDWPEGTPVVLKAADHDSREVGMREEDWPTDEAGIEALAASIDQIQPLLMTPEEEAEWQKARAEQKAWELTNWDAHSKKLEDLFK